MFLSEQYLLEKMLEGIVAMTHKGLVAYQVNRDSTAIQAWEKVVKKPEEKAPKQAKKRGTGKKQPKSLPKNRRSRKSRQHRRRKHRLRVSTKHARGGARKTVKGMYHSGRGTNCILISVISDFL
jgi:hypothetical protein